jgi:hypothetical protein
MYYMTPTCPSSWSAKGLLAVLRDTLPEHDIVSAATPAVASMNPSALALDDAAAKQARVDRMGRRLRQLVQAADVTSTSAVAA